MSKILNFLMFIIFLIFIIFTLNYYSSNKNIDTKNFNRLNIDQIISDKTSNLPVLPNDTDNVIEFNNSLENNDINKRKKRSFWDLIK